MKVIKPYYEWIDEFPKEIMKKIELAGRTAYKSEDKITEDSAEKFVKMLVQRGHESVIEHVNLTIKFVCDRGVTHELVRHRLVSYTQESTRYCDYSGKGITVIEPLFFEKDSVNYVLWINSMRRIEKVYQNLITNGSTPEKARCVLPNCLKTERTAPIYFKSEPESMTTFLILNSS